MWRKMTKNKIEDNLKYKELNWKKQIKDQIEKIINKNKRQKKLILPY